MANYVYIGLAVAQVFTLIAACVVIAGAALLQKKANTLALFNGLDAATLEATQGVYNDVFQSTTYIIPYPQRPQYQFQYQWWIITMELLIFIFTAALTLYPGVIVRARPVALTFLASALVLLMDNINAIFYLLRSDLAKLVFNEYRIQTAQAGLLMVAIGNCGTIICMGLYEHEPTAIHSTTAVHSAPAVAAKITTEAPSPAVMTSPPSASKQAWQEV